MDEKRAVCCERKFFTGAHSHLFEASMCAFHYFRHNAKHHRTADVCDHGVMKNPIVDLRFGSDQKTATFARTITEHKIDNTLFPFLIICFDLHFDGVMIKDDGLEDCSKIHKEAAQDRKLM